MRRSNKRLLLIVIIILAILGIAYAFNTGYININSNPSNPTISQCKKEFNDCARISYQKGVFNAKILKIQNFTDINEAQTFFNTWKGFTQPNSKGILPEKTPFILIASRVTSITDEKYILSLVMSCDENGHLSYLAKQNLGC